MSESGDGTEPVLAEDHFRRPSPARLWNYLQGGKDNYQIDRAAGDAMVAAYPDMFYAARQVRRFLMRAVGYAARDAGIRQFLDLGCGLPGPQGTLNTHEVAQGVDPRTRVVYSDRDKVVLAHARALLTGCLRDSGRIDYIDADIRDTGRILTEAAANLDFTQPVGVMCFGVLGYIPDQDEANAIVERLTATVPAGSLLMLEDGVNTDPGMAQACQEEWIQHDGHQYLPRDLPTFTGSSTLSGHRRFTR
ncbi:MAG TPA: SAM-dependent methyltransferase [Mycobacterium sp.]|jgi:O-methyltransferase involved in polyketide biosynthesis|nr:SAM-dependent methyltransferase [Mycobacterium sp.]